jgi:hypothetical protein
MFDSGILKPFMMCPYMGLEKRVKHIFGPTVKIYECKDTRKIRLVAYNAVGLPVSGLIINPYNRVRTYQIDAIYTRERFRRQGMAKQLLLVARYTFGTVNHNDNLTISGRLWRDSVENLK